ncbi:MAG: hypothetical protein OEN48_07110 [Betaproteobacteria bacterium]|nr:hypothetical protein [Betaproteobacteria bacterium]
MADPKQARQLIEELPANDAKALEEITYWLETINQTPGFKVEQRFDNVGLLDAAAKKRVRKLSLDYLSMPRQMKFQENLLWTATFGFWQQLGSAYLACVDQYDAGPFGLTIIRRSLPLMVARALRALTFQLKWYLLRYGPVEQRIWTDVGRLYQIAEKRGFADNPVAVYPESHHESTVRGEFLKAMMLAASSTDGLSPMRQEIVERAVAHYSGSFRVSRRPDGCTHCFNPASPKAPVRLFKGAGSAAGLCFFGAGRALGALEALVAKIHQTGEVPADVNLGGSYHKDLVIGALQHVAMYWGTDQPARSSERLPTTGRITVVPGFNDVLQALDPSTSDELDFSRDEAAESWLVENVSDAGYGTIIPNVKSDWIQVGTLIAMQSDRNSLWTIGLIRRIARDEQNQRHVGIQTLSRTAIPVRVARSGTTNSSLNVRGELQPAILLATAPHVKGEVGVILREGIFSARDSMEMTMRDKTYLLQPVRLDEGGEDFDWATFKVTERSA